MVYRFPIVIQWHSVGLGVQNFPFYFNQLAQNIPASFWSHVIDLINGLDIRFFDDDGVTELLREIEWFKIYNNGHKYIGAWILIPNLNPYAYRTIYCQVGGSLRANDRGIWTFRSPKGVYHLQENGKESSIHGFDVSAVSPAWGTNENGDPVICNSNLISNGIPLTRAADGGQDIVGNTFELSAWVYPRAYDSTYTLNIVGKGDNYGFGLTKDGFVQVLCNAGWGPVTDSTTFPSGLPLDEWTFVLIRYSPAGGLNINYPSRGGVGMSQTASGYPTPVSNPLVIGSALGDVLVDEVHIFEQLSSYNLYEAEVAVEMRPDLYSICGSEFLYSSGGFLPFFLNQGGRA